MKSKNSSEINWLNIITIKEFQAFLNIKLLKEISMASKLVRYKLYPLIFNSIILRSYYYDTNNIKCSTFDKYFNTEFYKDRDYKISSEPSFITIESRLKRLNFGFTDIKKYTKSLYLGYVEMMGYFLLSPLLNIFSNLTKLKLESCFIPYTKFFKLQEYSPNLTWIQLRRVMLARLSTDRISLDEFALPSNLEYLSISNCTVTYSDLLPNISKFLINEDSDFASSDFTLPRFSVPSLKKLEFFAENMQDVGLKEFLDLNPNLESLRIESLYSNLAGGFNYFMLSEIISLAGFNITQFPTLNSITTLKIDYVVLAYMDDNSDLRLFFSKFPNLKELDLTLYNINTLKILSGEFLTPILNRLPKLKILKLDISKDLYWLDSVLFEDGNDNDEEDKFDINNFNIEKIYLTAVSDSLLNINFENCKCLRQVMFCSEDESLNTEEFIQKFKCYKNWGFKFTENIIIGYKY